MKKVLLLALLCAGWSTISAIEVWNRTTNVIQVQAKARHGLGPVVFGPVSINQQKSQTLEIPDTAESVSILTASGQNILSMSNPGPDFSISIQRQ